MPHFALIPLLKLIGYPGIFGIIFLESGVFFGFFLPGASLLFTAGILSSHGIFNPWVLVPLVTVAAVLGDSVGYWFGRKVGAPLLERNTRFFRHEHMEQARVFYEKHGVLAIILARFVPIVRTFAPIVAGMAGMRYRLFLAYNIIGALLWGAGVTFLGYFLGEKVPFISQYLTPIIILIVGITCIPIIWHAYKNLPKSARQ
ncbi:MAG TPA: DedA family protein [Candidatus Paceibacterota bacterium]|nr:DedA family protein [Candidatus Paceibacterota bacterium]